jgi:hypothetical protein
MEQDWSCDVIMTFGKEFNRNPKNLKKERKPEAGSRKQSAISNGKPATHLLPFAATFQRKS